MRILVVLLLFLVGGLVVASRFGQTVSPPGEVAVREAPMPAQDEAAALSEEAEASPSGTPASPDEGGPAAGAPALEAGEATATGEEGSGPAAADSAEDGTVTLRLDDATAAGDGPAEAVPDAAPSGSPSLGSGPELDQPAAPDATAAMPAADATPEGPDGGATEAAQPEGTTLEPEVVEAPTAPAEPLPAEPLDPEEALAALDAEEEAALETGPEAEPTEAGPTPGAGDEAPAMAATSPSEGSSPTPVEPSPTGPAEIGPGQSEAASTEAASVDPASRSPNLPEPAPAPAEPASPEPPTAEPAPRATPEPALPPAPDILLPPAPPEADIRRMAADRVNLREGPGTDRPVLEVLSLDDEVEVLEAEGDWLRVRSAGGEEGWVAARFVAPGPD